MKKILMAAILFCAMTTTVVNAQEAESPIEKDERLAKAADDAPQDWQKQYDAAEFYLNDSNGSPNPTLAEKYATRALTHQGLVPVPLDLRRCRATKTRTRPIEKK